MKIIVIALLLIRCALANECETALRFKTTVRTFMDLTTVALTDANNHDVARLQFKMETASTAFITDAFTDIGYRDQGLMKFLFKTMLEKEPGIEIIEGNLSLDNKKAFLKGVPANEKIDFRRCAELARNTPAYKLRKAVGFAKIITCNWTGELVEFATSK